MPSIEEKSASGSPGGFQNLGPIQDKRDSLYVSLQKGYEKVCIFLFYKTYRIDIRLDNNYIL